MLTLVLLGTIHVENVNLITRTINFVLNFMSEKKKR